MANKLMRLAFLVAAVTMATAGWGSDEPPPTPEHVIGEQPYPFDSADPRYEEDSPPIELPDSLITKLSLLTPEEVEFLKSSDARGFAGPLKDTVEALDEKTP